MKKVIFLVCCSLTLLIAGCEAESMNTGNAEPEIIYDQEVFSMVEEPRRAEVARRFNPGAQKIVINNDLHVYRYWGGGSGESGFFFAKKMFTERDKAKRALALPERNTALNVTQYKIPAGTTLIYGNAANMAGEDGYDMEATGGAELYYLPNPRFAEKELVGKLEFTHHEQTMDELEEVEAVTVE